MNIELVVSFDDHGNMYLCVYLDDVRVNSDVGADKLNEIMAEIAIKAPFIKVTC